MLAVAATALSAHYAQPPGYSQGILPLTLGGTGSLVWDVTGGQAPGECYIWNDGDFRRLDPAAGTIAPGGLFGGLPGGQDSFDYAAIDPGNPDDVYASFSTFTPAASTIYVYTRTGPDAATQGASQSYSSYTAANTTAASPEDIAIFRMRFIPDIPSVPASLRGVLLAAGADTAPGLGLGPVKLWAVNTDSTSANYLELTELATILDPGANGTITVDADGNFYTVVGFGSPVNVVRYDAGDLADALAGTISPLQTTDAVTVIDPSDGVSAISAMAVRDEESVKYMYHAESNTGSIYRRNLETGVSRLWAQGFGPVDQFNYWGGASSLEFESLTDEFRPNSGGTTRLGVTFAIGAANTIPFQFGSIVSEFHVFEPFAANTLVNALSLSQSPGTVARGGEFTLTVEALNASGSPITSNVSVEVSLASGTGTLHGFLVHTGPGDSLVIEGLFYDSAGTGDESITLDVGVVGGGVSTPVNLTVVDSLSGGGGGGDGADNGNDSSSCTAAGGAKLPWLALLALLGALGVASRLRRART